MSQAFVIDASVGFAWLHPAQATPETEKLLEQVGNGAQVVVPALWFIEIANSLLVLQRRKKLTADERKSALETLGALNLTVDEESAREAFRKVSELAEKHGLTAYDAVYLELALRRKLPLASRDEALRQAAKHCGLKTL